MSDKIWVGFWIGLMAFVAWFGVYMVTVARPEAIAAQAARQVEINNFAAKHDCRPEGYVAIGYKHSTAIRTYRCDNGVYIAADMKGD